MNKYDKKEINNISFITDRLAELSEIHILKQLIKIFRNKRKFTAMKNVQIQTFISQNEYFVPTIIISSISLYVRIPHFTQSLVISEGSVMRHQTRFL